jgi:hypothetical protein
MTRIRRGTILGQNRRLWWAQTAGEIVALHATASTAISRNGWLFEGWQLYADTLFASPAVLDDWLYIADDAGVVYAFNQRGLTGSQLRELLPDIG